MSIETLPLTDLGSAAAKLVEKLAEIRQPIHAPGIYFGLEEAEYHADAALGSSAMKQLAQNPCNYWFKSPLNPTREEDNDDTPSKVFGRALHKCILEGEEAFRARYAPCEFPGNIKAGIEERKRILAAGKIASKMADWTRVLLAGATVQANPHLRDAFTNGLPEVSIFWEDNGIRKKARIDFLKVRASVDVKTAANEKEAAFAVASRGAFSTYRYDVQAAHYADGRAQMRDLMAAGAVYGDHDPAWLNKVTTSDEWSSVFLFIQSKSAPIVWAGSISPGNPILDVARDTITKAEANYREWMDRFGPTTPWVLVDPVEEITIDQLPAWYARG
jgi:hypothetical protein